MRISGCSTVAAAIDALPGVPFRASTYSGTRPDAGSGFDFGTNTGFDSDLVTEFTTLNFGCSIFVDAGVAVEGSIVVAIDRKPICAPAISVLSVKGSRSNTTIASNVTHRTVKR